MWQDIPGATTAPIGYKWQNNSKSRFSKEYKSRLIKEDKIMTREDKLYSMRMTELQMVADKLGIKINPKAAKSKAIEKILKAEAVNESEPLPVDDPEPEEINDLVPIPTPEEPEEPNAQAEPKKKRGNLKIKELTYNGETKTIKEWAEEIGMPRATLYDRVNRNGWGVEEAIETPLGQRRSK